MDAYFSDFFKVPKKTIEKYGAFNVSLIADLPLFIDPFLLFNSKKPAYRQLHNDIIDYLRFLRDKSVRPCGLEQDLVDAWYRFPEIKQNWLGFSVSGNRGSGLGKEFASALHENLHRLFKDFGDEQITKGSHLEKLCLIREGVGKDNISDFATNLVHEFLLKYAQAFAQRYIAEGLRKHVTVDKVRFNYETETWERGTFDLPWFESDYVLLTPKDILTKDETWINKHDLFDDFQGIPDAIPNPELRAQVNNYFRKVLPRRRDKEPTKKERDSAIRETILRFPQIIDYYIKYKEENGDKAESISSAKVEFSRQLYVEQFKHLGNLLADKTSFYQVPGNTYEEAHQRAAFLKDVIENKGGHTIFYIDGKPVEREADLQILYRLTWFATPSDVSREVNDGRGPADYKISRGSKDKTLVEFKLASNSQLKRNLEKQVEIYQKASDADKAIKVIIYFSEDELDKVNRVLKDLKLIGHRDIILIDARKDNKPSASKA